MSQLVIEDKDFVADSVLVASGGRADVKFRGVYSPLTGIPDAWNCQTGIEFQSVIDSLANEMNVEVATTKQSCYFAAIGGFYSDLHNVFNCSARAFADFFQLAWPLRVGDGSQRFKNCLQYLLVTWEKSTGGVSHFHFTAVFSEHTKIEETKTNDGLKGTNADWGKAFAASLIRARVAAFPDHSKGVWNITCKHLRVRRYEDFDLTQNGQSFIAYLLYMLKQTDARQKWFQYATDLAGGLASRVEDLIKSQCFVGPWAASDLAVKARLAVWHQLVSFHSIYSSLRVKDDASEILAAHSASTVADGKRENVKDKIWNLLVSGFDETRFKKEQQEFYTKNGEMIRTLCQNYYLTKPICSFDFPQIIEGLIFERSFFLELIKVLDKTPCRLGEGKYADPSTIGKVIKSFVKDDLKGFVRYFWWTIMCPIEIMQSDTKGYFYLLTGATNSAKSCFLTAMFGNKVFKGSEFRVEEEK